MKWGKGERETERGGGIENEKRGGKEVWGRSDHQRGLEGWKFYLWMVSSHRRAQAKDGEPIKWTVSDHCRTETFRIIQRFSGFNGDQGCVV